MSPTDQGLEQLRRLTEHLIGQPSIPKPKDVIFHRILQSSPSSIVVTDVEGNILYVNPKFSEVTGYEYDEIIGKNPRILRSGEQPAEWYKSMWDTILAGKEWRGEFHNKRKDGSLFWEQASIGPIPDSEGKIAFFVAVKEDVTAMRATQDALKRSIDLYKAVYDNAPLAFVIWDFNFIVTDWNKRAEEMFGWKAQEVIGRNFLDFFVEIKDRELLIPYLKELLRDPKKDIPRRWVNHNFTKSGSLLLCEWFNSPLQDSSGMVASVISLGRDYVG